MMPEYELLIGASSTGYYTYGGTKHVALYAQTGAGKTQSFSLPNCFAWPGSLIVLDIKQTCFEYTAGYRKYVLGQDVYLINPTALDGRSHRINPLSVIDRTSLRRFDQITRQSNLLLVPRPKDGGNAAAYWEPRARGAINAVMALLAETPNELMTYTRLLHIMMRGDYHNWLVNQINARRAAGNPYSDQVVLGISDFLGGSEELVNAVRSTVTANLWGFWNPVMEAATEISDFNFADIRRRPMTVYIATSPADIPRTQFLLRLLFDQALNQNTDRTPKQDPTLRVPVLLLLDEFAQLGPMPTLAHAAQFAREFGIRVAYVIQDKAQLYDIYGPSAARDIFSNMGLEIVFGTNDLEQARELENRMGDNTVQFDTMNRPRFLGALQFERQTMSRHPHRRPVALDHEILQMPEWKELLLSPGMRPGWAHRITGYTDQNFMRCVLMPPPIPKLKVSVRYDDGSVVIPLRGARTGPPVPATVQAAAPGSLLTPLPPIP